MYEKEIEIYSPKSIIGIYNNTLKIKEERKQIYLKGVYQRTGKNMYGKNYYDRIIDENDNFEITLIVSEVLRSRLKDGFVYEFLGYLNRRIDERGSIKFNYYASQIKAEKGRLMTQKQIMLSNIIETKINKGFRDIDSYIENSIHANSKIKIALIIANNSEIENDILDSLNHSKKYFIFTKYTISLNNKQEIINQIKELDDAQYDIIALSRGGGEDLRKLDDVDIAETISNIKTFFVTAIGHTDDRLFIEDLADKKYRTPTDFGYYLENTYNKVLQKLEGENMQRREYEHRISEFKEKVLVLEKNKKYMYIFIIISFIIGFILSKV